MIGIYSIKSPSGKLYIGQSIDIERRFKNYMNLNNCKGQTKLYNSLVKYGSINHTFSIIELCDESQLIELETYWKKYYSVLDSPSLCCKIDGKGGRLSEETKSKIGKSNSKPKPLNFPKGSNHKLTGTKHTEGTKQKISKSNQGRKLSDTTKNKIGDSNKGKNGKPKGFITSDETKLKISNSNKGNMHSLETKQKISDLKKNQPTKKSTPVLQFSIDGEFIKEWNKIKEASTSLGKALDTASITCCCKGKQKTAFGFIWKYKD